MRRTRDLNGQLLWLGMRCLPRWLAPLSLLRRKTPPVTVGTIYEVNKLARKATASARTPLKIYAHPSPVVVLDGAPHKMDSWFSLKTPSCCGAESQTSWHSS